MLSVMFSRSGTKRMKKITGIALIYAALIFLVFGTVMSVLKVNRMTHFADRTELSGYDFSKECGVLDEYLGDKYVNKLIYPNETDAFTPDGTDAEFENYVTYRFTAPVKEGVNYAVTCKKSDYALKVFADGILIAETGRVSDSKEEFVPTASAYEAFFTGKGESVEIVIWQANFNHHKHYPIWFRLGPAEKISEYNRKVLFENVIAAVVLATAALFNFGMFLCFTSRRELLWFSCICICSTIGTIFPEITGFLVPDVNWYVSHKLEICSVVAILFFAILYVGVLFKQYVNQKLMRLAIIVTGSIFVLFAFSPSLIYSRCNEASLIVITLMLLPMLVSMVIKMVKWRKTIPDSNLLALIGVVAYGLISLNEGLGYDNYFKNLDIIGTTTGVAMLAFFNSLALAIDFRSSLELLRQAEALDRELDQTNKALTRLDRIREAFLSDLSHELKTPLTVIASNAAVSAKQVSLGRADDKTAERLGNIEREAVRLGKMVEKLKNSAKGQYSEEPQNLAISTVLKSAADFCMPLCARNGNTISVDCAENIKVFSSSNTMFHCLYNLISNATKHSRNSEIELICTTNEGGVVISVKDHGDGMTEEQMKHAFERGFSGDSSTGIGLPLCRELVENEGGTIFLSHTKGGGLTASFVLKEGADDGENTDD